MKLIDKMVETAFETSPTLKRFVNDVNLKIIDYKIKVNEDVSLALDYVSKMQDRISDLTTAVINITQTLQLHQKAITDLYSMQNAINSALQDRRPSIELPEGKKNKSEKPN